MEATNLYDTIAMIGQGHIGLPPVTLFSSRPGYIGVEINQPPVNTIFQSRSNITEPEQIILTQAAAIQNHLHASRIIKTLQLA
jgi:UDP-N-acetyl-D-mannosaminuronate dehydrogenase